MTQLEDAVPLARFATYMARAHAAGAGKYGWRLLAANNRDVARSAELYVEVDSCYDAIRHLRAEFAQALPVVARIGRSEWSWRLRLDEIDLVMSSRTYQRRLQCTAACDLFMELALDAAMPDLGVGD